MTTTLDRPSIAESLASAGNSSDLTVDVDRRGDVDLLIAAGKATHVVGRHLDQLVSEWGLCAPPRRLGREEVERVAQALPPVVSLKDGREIRSPDLKRAHEISQTWMDAERRRIIARLKSLPKLMDVHAGLVPWIAARGAAEPQRVLLDVLAWYLERRCAVCHGTKWDLVPGTNRQSNKPCRACRGSGERDTPHGALGIDVLALLTQSAAKARASTREVLRNIHHLKRQAAGL